MTHIRHTRSIFSLIGMSVLLAIGTVCLAAQDELDNEADDEVQELIIEDARPGTLLLPAGVESGDAADTAKKQCMTVCSRWGEECTFINRGIGGMSRKCRRACKQFSEECF